MYGLPGLTVDVFGTDDDECMNLDTYTIVSNSIYYEDGKIYRVIVKLPTISELTVKIQTNGKVVSIIFFCIKNFKYFIFKLILSNN